MTSSAAALPRRAARIPAEVAGAVGVLIGGLVIAGWLTHQSDLVQLQPGQTPVQFNTAFCLVLLGVALLLLLTRWVRYAAAPLVVAACWGAATLLSYATGESLVDTLLFDPWLTTGTPTPGRMAGNTAICVTVLGVAGTWLAATRRRTGRAPLAVGTAGSLVAGVALVALFGHASDVATAFAWRSSTAMAPVTAATLLLLGVGYVSAAWGAASVHRAPRWLPVPVAVGALAVSLFLWQSLVTLGEDQRVISLDRAAGSVLAIGLVFSALLAGAAALGQQAIRRRREAEAMGARLSEEVAFRAARAERDEVLRAAYQVVSSARDLADGFAEFADVVGVALPFDRVSLSVVEGPSIRIAAVAGPRAHTLPVGSRLAVTNPIVAEMLATKEAYVLQQTFTEFDAGGTPRAVRGSLAAAPIVVAGEVRATLAFASTGPDAFSEDDLALIGELIGAVGGALYTIGALREEELTSARLRELDQLKNEFVGVVAHDLRSPMTVISGYVDTVLQRWDDLPDGTKRELLEVASKNTKRLSVMVEDVLQVARIESGDFPYEIAPFDLGALVRRTAAEMNAARPDRPVEADVPDDLPTALGDEDRQWRVLTNLLSNAQKFSPPGVPVTVTVRLDESSLAVTVADRGPGIAADDLPRLFGKFARLASAPDGEKGTGLGLYICKALVEAQGGTIGATSTVGQGTTLRYTVPRTRESL